MPSQKPRDGAPVPITKEPGPVVGIGASAGGLHAFSRFLRHLPPDTGYAFVFVQHLDASHPSSLSEILGRATAMPVADASDGAPVLPNCLYVIPPNTDLTIADHTLRLAPRAAGLPHMAVDRFLKSLAEDCGTAAVGVVLSGSGSDGAVGLRAIKDAGGMTFAQEPSSAEFPSMPAAAATAGAADLLLPPEGIARELARIARHPFFDAASTSQSGSATNLAVDDAALRRICDIMREATGVDFSLYRETTVQRRILRRLAMLNIANVDEYTRLLAEKPDERTALHRDLLIGVTSFFRDPDSFDSLKTSVFPAIVRDRPSNSTIRVWVPGCATGEEAYSILIALHEFQDHSRTAYPVQIFASDINETALETGRSGRYPASIAVDVSAERLRRHFVSINGSYQIAKNIRDQCLFSRHNLLEDPPFSKIDLVSCRNVLIYLDTVQRRVIPLFHYALVDGGFLTLGRSETTHHEDLFAPVDGRRRIYVKREVAKTTYESFARTGARARNADRQVAAGAARTGPTTADVSRSVDRILLAKYSPAGVLVDESLDVLEIRGRPEPFLSLTPGKAGLHLLKHVPDVGLFLELEGLIREAASSGEVVQRHGVPYEAGGRSGRLNVEVTPLRSSARRAFLIFFEPVDAAATDAPGNHAGSSGADPSTDPRIAKLTRELAAARERLVSLVDDQQSSDAEHQQIAEDALSANEELQSLTEELETAKEELQAANEELLTVNRELESRNASLASALELTKSIVQTVAIPLLVVDGELVVRQMNGAFLKAFRLSHESGEGRPFYELCGGAWDMADLRTRIGGLLAGRQTFEPVELQREFPTIGTRVLIVGGVRLEHLGSILLTIEDITGQRAAEEALQRSEERRRQSEKMETIGRLAGGIAHDFNNLLTVIFGNAELVRDALGHDHHAIHGVTEIREAATKAAALTDQLLSFSRRKVLLPKVFDLNPVVADFEKMLRRLLGEQIRFVVRLSPEPALVKADPAEIGRVVMNLCVNARDAMPAGGVLTIETGHVSLDEAGAAESGLIAGQYIQLAVADTGLGMDADTRLHAFEPFFTTKDAAKGAGLGLATVFGILQQSGGSIACDSELGEGTRFRVLLPVAPVAEHPSDQSDRGLGNVPKGTAEVVLVVEDEDSVRLLTTRVLERSGYVVLEAKDGREGLSVIESHAGLINIIVTDVLMPDMGGGALVQRARALRPVLKVLFVSGHSEDVLVQEGVTKGMPFLQKPFAPADLARKVREVLDS